LSLCTKTYEFSGLEIDKPLKIRGLSVLVELAGIEPWISIINSTP
ncbi:MAG: hypothetical protein ACJAS1_005249, partial [Oleiphilaceae bacterium]